MLTKGFGVANVVVPGGDGGTAVLTENGIVVRFDNEGRMLWARTTGIPEADALVSTADNGYLAGGRIIYQVPVNDTAGAGTVVRPPVITTETGAGGPVLAEAASRPTTPGLAQVPRRFDLVGKVMVVRLAPDGAIAWERQYDDGGLDWLQSLAEGPERAGLLAGYGDYLNGSPSIANPLLALHLSPDGTPAVVTQIDTASVGEPVWIRSDAAGYRVLYRNTTGPLTAEGLYRSSVVDAALDRNGCVLERRPLDASIAVTWTADGGFFSVGIPPVGNRSGAAPAPTIRPAPPSTLAGSTVPGVWSGIAAPAARLDQAVKVVQTADGGYAVLGLRQNR